MGSYTTPRLHQGDSGTQYRVMVSIPPVCQPSDPATLTVIEDKQFPIMDKIGSLFNSMFLAVRFSEEVDLATATVLSNYIVYDGVEMLPLKSATFRPDGATLILELNQGVTNRLVMWAEQIKDINGNLLSGMFRSSDVIMLYNDDLGTPGVDPLMAGATYGVSSSEFEIVAGGSGIGGTADAAQFAYQKVTGDFDLKVRVASLVMKNAGTQAGLMVREDLDANSRQLSMLVTPAEGLNCFQCIRRDTKWSDSTTTFSGGVPSYPEAWVRLQRVGNAITAYYGQDGAAWTVAAAVDATAYPAAVYIGIVASARNNSAGNATSAQFRDLRITAKNAGTFSDVL